MGRGLTKGNESWLSAYWFEFRLNSNWLGVLFKEKCVLARIFLLVEFFVRFVLTSKFLQLLSRSQEKKKCKRELK